MLTSLRMSATLAACFLAAACSSATEIGQSPSAAIAPQASPVDLDKLAALAGIDAGSGFATAPAETAPADALEPQIVPAKASEFESDALIEDLPAPSLKETFLRGAMREQMVAASGPAYRGISGASLGLPVPVARTFRTVEFKN